MIHLFYNIAFFFALPGIIAYHIYRSISRGRPSALAPRFGFHNDSELTDIALLGPIWVHAVSVGETIAVKPLLTALKSRFPDRPIVLSNMTETGRSIAKQMKEVDYCLYFPFDYEWVVKRTIRQVNPLIIVIMETEIWPNLLHQAKKHEIPAVIVNGRISDRSFVQYKRLSWFFRPVLAEVTAFCMQTDEDARRIKEIGALEGSVQVARNLKFDIPVSCLTPEEKGLVRNSFRLPQGINIFTAGSTHPGEETVVIAAFRQLLASGHKAVLVLVPRHPERADEVASLLIQAGLSHGRRSALTEDSLSFKSGEVLLVDTIGELMRIYSASDLVFVGGSLVPVGGHNVLEPASLGLPVLFGPHMSNFREIAAKMEEVGACRIVEDGDDLSRILNELLLNDKLRRQMGSAGQALLVDNSGATEKHIAVLARLIKRG